MCFDHSKLEKLKIGSAELYHKTSCKNMGVHLDKKLNFHDYIGYVVKKLSKFRGLIYRIRHFYSRKCLLVFCNSFAKSIKCYGLLVHEVQQKRNCKIETVQRRIIRASFFKTRLETLVDVLADHRIPNVFEICLKEVIRELFKEIRNESPLKLSDINLFTHNSLVIR